MTQIGEGVAAGGGKGPNKPDLEENHWLELEYRYQSGAPIYGTYEAIDSEGMIWTGRLNDEGQVCLAGLPEGDVQVSLLPEENTDTELEETRKAIQTVLDQIVADQRAEAEEYERELEQMGGARRAFTHIHSFGKGLWNGAIGVVEFVGDTAYKVVQIADYLGPINQLGNVLKAGYQSYQSGELTWDEWYDSVNENLQNEHKRDVARLLGVEPDDLSEERLRQLMQMVAEAYDIAAFIADDQETQDMLKQFAEDMADAQHSVEWAEFAGAGVFELVLGALLAIFTGGAGNVAQAASKLRHAARLRNLGHLFRKLARLLRRKKLNKSVDAPVDQKTATNTDQPDIIELEPRGNKSKNVDEDSGGGGYRRTVKKPDDLVEDESGVYGYMPTEDSQFHSDRWPVDWSDKEQVSKARGVRLEYHEGLDKKREKVQEMRNLGSDEESIARKLVDMRNEDRLSHYKDPEALEAVYQRNMKKYGSKYGPTYESQLEKYETPSGVIDAALRSNDTMDVLTGIAKPIR